MTKFAKFIGMAFFVTFIQCNLVEAMKKRGMAKVENSKANKSTAGLLSINANKLILDHSISFEKGQVQISGNGLEVKLNALGPAVFHAAQPFSLSSGKIVQYFEVELKNLKNEKGENNNVSFGLEKPDSGISTKYSSLLGELIYGQLYEDEFGPKLGKGDKVGCGLFVPQGKEAAYIFYTKHSEGGKAELIGKLIAIPKTHKFEGLFPNIDLIGQGTEVKVAFFDAKKPVEFMDKLNAMLAKGGENVIEYGQEDIL